MSKNMSIARIGAYIGKNNVEKLDAICAKFDVAKGGLLEVLILGTPDEVIGTYIAAGKEARDATKVDLRKGRQDTMSKLRKLPAEQLEALLAQAGVK